MHIRWLQGGLFFSFAVVVVGSHNVRIDTHPLDGQIIVCGGISLNPIQGGFYIYTVTKKEIDCWTA